MAITGNIIIEDDVDDKEIFREIIKELGYLDEIKWFVTTDKAIDYLKNNDEDIFLICCDINLPGKNGLQLKMEMDSDPQLRKKSIPFIFLSTNASQRDVNDAFTKMTVQGFFKKENSYARMKEILKTVLEYWSISKHPHT